MHTIRPLPPHYPSILTYSNPTLQHPTAPTRPTAPGALQLLLVACRGCMCHGECVSVRLCVHMHAVRVCCMWWGMCEGVVGHVDGSCVGGGWPPTSPPWPSQAWMCGAGWWQLLWQVLWVCAGVCGWCSGVCWGAARQRKLTLGQQHPPGPDSPPPASEAPPESRTYRPHSERRHSGPVGVTFPPVPVGGACRA